MAKANLSVIARPPQFIVSRQSESFCSTPSNALRTWWPDGMEMDLRSGAVFLKTVWQPTNYAYGKDDYQTYPADKTLWIEGGGALGKGDKSIGFAGDGSNPASTPWVAFLDTTNAIGRNRGVVFSFLWYRPTDTTMPGFNFYPRLDHTRYTDAYGGRIYFTPFSLTIDQQMRMNVWEYPYDNYDQFAANPITSLKKQYTHPLNVTPESLASRWHSIYVMPLSDDDVLISSDILEGGGFIYRSALDRDNIFMLPEGIAGIHSTVGGTGQIQVTPIETASTGSIKSQKFSKTQSNAVYPTVSAFGWSPALINTDRGFMTNQTIASGATGTGGIRYDIYSVVTTGDVETETLVDPSGGVEFKDFKILLTLTPSTHVSPVINDVIVEFGENTATIADPTTDISNDVMALQGQVSDDGNVRFSVKVRNQDNVYNDLAQRVMTELDVDLDGQDLAVLYTLNPSYDWLKTPTQGALELNWETGDGFVYLQREMCARMPAYDGQLVSTALTEFMGRLGYDASRLDIDVTDGTIGINGELRLPKKQGKEPYQFKPEDGTPAADFLKKVKEWFGPTHSMRFRQDGVFEFKYIPTVGGLEVPTIHRTYYPLSTDKPTTDDHVVYRDAKVELVMDQFYNEIWVVGEDKRKTEPLIAVYQDLPSQNDKNSPKYVGRRLLMIVLTKLNNMDALASVCERLSIFYGDWDVRLQFNTRVDPTLQKDDFIKLHGVAATWRVKDIGYNINLAGMADGAINSGTPVVKGMSVTAVQWPVYW